MKAGKDYKRIPLVEKNKQIVKKALYHPGW